MVEICNSEFKTCEDCPLRHKAFLCGVYLTKYIKNEPAPAATGTGSTKKENTFQIDDSTKEQICQAYDTVDEACADIIDIYETMSEREHRAFNIGEVYGKICSTRDKLEKLRGGDGNEH